MGTTITEKEREDALNEAVKNEYDTTREADKKTKAREKAEKKFGKESNKAEKAKDAEAKANKKAKDAGEHLKLTRLGYVHKDSKALGGGRCLQRCQGAYKKNCSCSYRWQAAHRATYMDPEMYEIKDRNAWLEQYTTASSDKFKSRIKEGYRVSKDKKGKVETNTGGTVMKKRVKAFQTGRTPWENNAHHIIPIGALKGAIFEVIGKDMAKLAQPIMNKLMESPYNVNHWRNMVILPCNEKQGASLGLPTHPPQHHPDYSKKVFDRLCSIFREAHSSDIKAANKNDKDHKDQELTGDVAKSIEALQEEIYTAIKLNRSKIRAMAVTGDDIKIDTVASYLVR